MAIPNFSQSNAYPRTHKEAGASGAQVITIDPRRTSAVYVLIDHADGGTVALGGGTAVKVPGQEYQLAWLQPAHPGTADETIEVNVTTASDLHVKVY